jgi:hypothetical protein
MSNTTKVIDMIANEALAIAHEKATFISTVDRQYDDSFGKAGAHKIGSTLRVRYPNQYTRRQGSRVMDVQDQNEATQTITLATQDGVDMRFNSAELALDTNNPSEVERFSKRYIEPAMSVLVSGIDGDALTQFTKDTYNLVGTAGTVVGASGDISALFNARAKLNQNLAPKGDRQYQIDSVTMASIVNGKTGLFHPDGQVKKAFTEGFYGRAAGADFYENERTYAHTNGSDHTTVTVNDAAIASGDTVITTAGASVTVGTVFTIADVYAVHPETKQSYGVLQQFVITAVSGNDWTISPALISTGAKQNISALPVTSAVITLHGSASTAYRQNIVYHKDAFAFVTADLPLMDDAHKCVRKTMDGMSVRVWMASDIRNDELLVRLDMLYGFKTLRPEWACRISN